MNQSKRPQLNPDLQSLKSEEASLEFSKIFRNWEKDWPHLVKTESTGETATHTSGSTRPGSVLQDPVATIEQEGGDPDRARTLSQEELASFISMFPDVGTINCNDSVASNSVPAVIAMQHNFPMGDIPFETAQYLENFKDRFPASGNLAGSKHGNQSLGKSGVHGASQKTDYTTSRHVGQEGAGLLTPPPTPPAYDAGSEKLVSATLQGPFDDAFSYFPPNDGTEDTVTPSHTSTAGNSVLVHYPTPLEYPSTGRVIPISAPTPSYHIRRKPVPTSKRPAYQVRRNAVPSSPNQGVRPDSKVETAASSIPSVIAFSSSPSPSLGSVNDYAIYESLGNKARSGEPFEPVFKPLTPQLATTPARKDGAPSSGDDLFGEGFWQQLNDIVDRCSQVTTMLGPSLTSANESQQYQRRNEQEAFGCAPAKESTPTIFNHSTSNSFARSSASTRTPGSEHGQRTKRSRWRKRMARFARRPRTRPGRMETWSQTGSHALKGTQQPFAERLKKGLGGITKPFKPRVIIG